MLVHRGLGRPVGEHHAVRDEVAVVRLVAEVPAVRPPVPLRGQAITRQLRHRAGLRRREACAVAVRLIPGEPLEDRVVPELPDEPALQPGVDSKACQ